MRRMSYSNRFEWFRFSTISPGSRDYFDQGSLWTTVIVRIKVTPKIHQKELRPVVYSSSSARTIVGIRTHRVMSTFLQVHLFSAVGIDLLLKAGEGDRTLDIQLGKLTLYR